MKKLIAILIVLFAVIAGVALVRTARFTSRQIQVPAAEALPVDRDDMVRRLSQAIQYKTVSESARNASATGEFKRFRSFLAQSFPRVHTSLAREVVGKNSLLYTWKGENSALKPILLMGHMDVVPADVKNEGAWTYPPFSGRVADGYIWGRGTMDDKVNVLGILEAAELLLKNGFRPRRTFYFAFGHDEEIGGNDGAAQIASLLHRRDVRLDYVLDEGGNIVDGIIPGAPAPVALVGIAEKGYVSLELGVKTSGGHASTPPNHTAIGILSGAIVNLEHAPFPTRLSEPVRQMFAFIGPEMAWPRKFILANLWLFGPLVRWQLAKSPLTNAAIRTTLAATVFSSGVGENLLPSGATAVVNARILPGDTVEGVMEHARRVIDNDQVKISPLATRVEPSAISDPRSMPFQYLHRAIKETAPGVIVAPALLVASTDSHHYARLSENVFRFLPITLHPQDARRFHGLNERISISDYERCVRFFVQLMRDSDA